MSDQFGNNVDGEIRVPIKYGSRNEAGEWQPLGANSWIDRVGTYTPKDGSQKPGRTDKQWAIAYADGTLNEGRFADEGNARRQLQTIREHLRGYGVPEEYWPVLMERTVETVASSWKILDV